MTYSITFASRYKKNCDVTEVQIANEFVFSDFYVAALCNLCVTICGSYMEQVLPPLLLYHGLMQSCGAVIKMTQLHLRSSSFHEHSSSSRALGFHEYGSSPGALFLRLRLQLWLLFVFTH